MKLPDTRNYIVIKSLSDLDNAMRNMYCRFIVYEQGNSILVWYKYDIKWLFSKYTIEGESVVSEDNTRGIEAYQRFYKYCGKDEIEKMKTILKPIEIWESEEQLHYANPKYANIPMKGQFFELDVNSSFTYGTLLLSDDFKVLKNYMLELYELKKNARDKNTRTRYKNLQNFLIGYFARVKAFVSLRSEIIKNSNENIISKIALITRNGGTVYLSNTDSIVTDVIGFAIMQPFIGEDVGKFKVEKRAEKLYYNSSNSYQIDNKITYSGMKYFARKNSDLFNEIRATQDGELIKAYNFDIETPIEDMSDICKIKESKITVNIYNKLGEKIETKIYKINLEDIDL